MLAAFEPLRSPYPSFLLVLLLALLLASRRPPGISRWFRGRESGFRRIARRRKLSLLLVGLFSFFLSAVLSLGVRLPVPAYQDEFSYLLAADTFAQGRLTNPTHPLWVHFESFHILQHPSYMSKYPPGQGAILALGWTLGGHPIVGAWLGVALACAALCWMLMAWLPARWALLGGLLAAVHPLSILWSQSYWGGGVAMAGGALALGAFRRIVRQPCAFDAVLMGTGMGILANSRPYEGLVLSLLLVATLILRWVGPQRPEARVLRRQVALPMLVTLALFVGAMGIYNRSVTGSPLRMPYMAYVAQYEIAPPLFLFQPLLPRPVYRHKPFHDFYGNWQVGEYRRQRASLKRVAFYTAEKAYKATRTFFDFPILLVALARVPRRDRWARWTLLTLGLFLAALLPLMWMNPHYAAPGVGLMFVLALFGLRRLRLWRWRGRPLGRWVIRLLPLLGALSVLHTLAALLAPSIHDWSRDRDRIERALAARRGERHLVIVRYGKGHSEHQEWVYNRADIDGAAVVWAREMDAARNRRLLAYFHDRRAWLLEVDAETHRLSPYPAKHGIPGGDEPDDVDG